MNQGKDERRDPYENRDREQQSSDEETGHGGRLAPILSQERRESRERLEGQEGRSHWASRI